MRTQRTGLMVLLSVMALLLSGLTFTSLARGADPDVVRGLSSTDGGDGTYTVPVLNADVPDVSVARVPAAESGEGRDVYYMLSTTMHLSPGAPVMKSYDLVNWEIVNYVFDRIDISDALSLRNGANSYGAGQWAPSLRYHDGKFYAVFNTNNVGGVHIYITDDIENGPWTHSKLGRGLHDVSLFFDEADGGTPYLIYGGGRTTMLKLNDDLTQVLAEYPDVIKSADFPETPLASGLAYEGTQAFYIDGQYYLVAIIWPSGGNRQVVMFRSPELLGRYATADKSNPYEVRTVLDSDGFAQGSLVEVADEDGGTTWHGFFFRDTYPIGRIPALIPAVWQDGWPTFGRGGVVRRGDEFGHLINLPDDLAAAQRLKSIVASDDFANDAAHKSFRDEQWTLSGPPPVDASLIGVNLAANGDFETGALAPWAVQYTARLAVVDDPATAGGHVLSVSGRVNNGSGPGQVLTGTVQRGVTYTGSMRVRYDTGPDTMAFILAFNDGSGIKQIGRVTATRGQWATLNGTYAVAANADVSNVKLVVETPWAPNQTAADQVDYLVDDISLVGAADPREYPTTAEYAHNGSDLDLAWEWNHNPDNRYWSLTQREGWLRLTNGHTVTGSAAYSKAPARELAYFEEARNTLSQRTVGPKTSAEVKLDVSGMKDGDVAGLAVYTRSFAYAGIKQVGGQRTLGLVQRLQPLADAFDQTAAEAFVPGSTVPLGNATIVHLKADADFVTEPGRLWVQFRYSLDGRTWQPLGPKAGPLAQDWSLSHFMGYRFGIFNYALTQTGGHVDVDHYLLSGSLTADGTALDRSLLDGSIAAGSNISRADASEAEWTELQRTLAQARAVQDPSTQNQIDAPAYALAAIVADIRVNPGSSSPSPSPSVTPSPSSSASPTGTHTPGATATVTATGPTTTVTAPPPATDLYSTPGFHHVNGRWWYTSCEPYSQTLRCRTEIWASIVRLESGRPVRTTGWAFNNLTYLPWMTRAQWGDSPLAHPGTWTVDGRRWKTECGTPETGRDGCRSWIWATVVEALPSSSGPYTYVVVQKWVLNNMVRFKV